MTTLADLKIGDAFVLLARVTAQDPVTGDTLTYYGPDSQPQGTMVISPAGAFSGQLAAAANLIPVQPVPGFGAVSPGDVLQNTATGETMVARLITIGPQGQYTWSAATPAHVWYSLDDWSVIGHVTL